MYHRNELINSIEQKLSILSKSIETRGHLNLLDLHLHAENFYTTLLNLIFDFKLSNRNINAHNAEAVDLIDVANKLIVQVSATNTKTKIQDSLDKIPNSFNQYKFIFISISKPATELRSKTYKTPSHIIFFPKIDILDIAKIIQNIMALSIEKIQTINDFLSKEISPFPSVEKIHSNIAEIIEILSKENWGSNGFTDAIEPFDISNKIDYNNLDNAALIIEDYAVHHPKIQQIYDTYDRMGVNKSLSILQAVRFDFAKIDPQENSDSRFFKTIECVKNRVLKSANFPKIHEDELELCCQIIVVDAFVRCKIFKNPHATT